MSKKYLYIVLVVLIVSIGAVVALRLITPEDTWLCKNGQWIKHGHPSSQMPAKVCK